MNEFTESVSALFLIAANEEWFSPPGHNKHFFVLLHG